MIEFQEDTRLLTAELEIEEHEKRDEDEEARYDGTLTPGGEVRASDAMRYSYYYYYTSGKGIYAVSDSRRRDEKLIRRRRRRCWSPRIRLFCFLCFFSRGAAKAFFTFSRVQNGDTVSFYLPVLSLRVSWGLPVKRQSKDFFSF